MKGVKKCIGRSMILMLLIILIGQEVHSQQVEVQGELKVTEMSANDTQDNLVVRNTDGTLGTRSASSLPAPPPPIDTTRNLASDFELAKHLCDCPNLPPFMITKLLDSGYTPGELIGSGIPAQEIIDAQRFDYIIDTRNNKSYKTVKIGTQTWMAENLNIGSRIDGSNDQLDNEIIEKYCYDNNDINCDIGGGLYQWNEIMQYVNTPGTQGICPSDWHLPTDNELIILEIELGMTPAQSNSSGTRGTNQGSKLAGTEPFWLNGLLDQNSAFDESGFGLLPEGSLNINNSFQSQTINGSIWSSTGFSSVAYYRGVTSSNSGIYRAASNITQGFNVRCVKD